jgi:hypothetical protein
VAQGGSSAPCGKTNDWLANRLSFTTGFRLGGGWKRRTRFRFQPHMRKALAGRDTRG